jgi:hypothetical protein
MIDPGSSRKKPKSTPKIHRKFERCQRKIKKKSTLSRSIRFQCNFHQKPWSKKNGMKYLKEKKNRIINLVRLSFNSERAFRDCNGWLGARNARECGFPEGINHCGVIESNWNEIVDIFGYMNLKESLLCICAYGFEKPSAIYSREQGLFVFLVHKSIIWLIKFSPLLARQQHLLLLSWNSWR